MIKVWTTRRGETIKIKDMTKEHLYNALCYLTGRMAYDREYFNLSDKDADYRFKELEKRALVLADELKKRRKKC